jgi:hypothetical protein
MPQADADGCPSVYWMTQEFNDRAQTLRPHRHADALRQVQPLILGPANRTGRLSPGTKPVGKGLPMRLLSRACFFRFF